MSSQKKSPGVRALPAGRTDHIHKDAMSQDGVVSLDALRDGESIECRLVEIGNLLAPHADQMVMGLRHRIEPDGIMQRRQSGNDAVPGECLERGVHRGMGDGRVRPLDPPEDLVRTRMGCIPQECAEDEQALWRDLHPGSFALLDKSLDPGLQMRTWHRPPFM